ncbi:LOW QUALITY PROTEIN: 2-oxoglutarate and iron-dependent oxygenase domain-containing protein 2 [Trichosurus vulpecula]|uniref:LOW QUALITY PROTEIN: 2-oxoglutarate and iron-dependent oxygenase domain-containing protein 2 n=1 Tax=Trichosurus vulpecula TaxID=9337 RepID=UPI00186AFE83|nr:LOW QUALITY PROTEIN: 2-oxoglutarate and iron-dependent oxygenase domain-containing protein 2 [Trichosurus vulpecula]
MAGPGAAGRRFFRCACFCSENLFLPRYRLHVHYSEEQQLRRDYGPILKNRGCVSPEDFEQVLAELEKEVQRRKQLVQRASERKATIAQYYLPVQPQVYGLQERFLAPEFLTTIQYCVSPGADLPGLLQRIETLSGEKMIYRLPVFTQEFCQMLLQELENFEQSDMPKGRPNTMNSHGVLLDEMGLDKPLVIPLRERYLQPLTALLYPDCGGGRLDSHRAFVVKYSINEDRDLSCHYDNAEVTLNVSLNKNFSEGNLYFGDFHQVLSNEGQYVEVPNVLGHGILHRGGQLHGALPLESGERWNLIIWMRASSVRNRLCPMCKKPPELVEDEGFGDGFTREEGEPSTVDVCALT